LFIQKTDDFDEEQYEKNKEIKNGEKRKKKGNIR